MATFECFKCGGKGKIRGFEHIENGDCFQCAGTGRLMSREERSRIVVARQQKRIDTHDLRLAKSCGLSLEEFRRIAHGKGAA